MTRGREERRESWLGRQEESGRRYSKRKRVGLQEMWGGVWGGYGEGGVEKEGRSEGRTAGSMYICHPLLLQAKNAQEERERRKKSRRTRRGRQVGALCHQQEEHY